MVDFGKGAIVPFDDLMDELLELVAEDADHFGCSAEVAARARDRRATARAPTASSPASRK